MQTTKRGNSVKKKLQ